MLVEQAARLDFVELSREHERVLEQLELGAFLALLVDFQRLQLVLQRRWNIGWHLRIDVGQAEAVLVLGVPVVEQLVGDAYPQCLGELRPGRFHVDDRGDRFDAVLAAGHRVVDLLDLVGCLGPGQVLEEQVVGVAVQLAFEAGFLDRHHVVRVQIRREGRPALAQIGCDIERAVLHAEFAGIARRNGRHHVVHHPLGGRLVEPCGVTATRLPVHRELQGMQELVREHALDHEPGSSRPQRRAEELVAQAVEHHVAGPLRAGVADLGLLGRQRVGRHPGAPPEHRARHVVDVVLPVAAVAGLLAVVERKSIQQPGVCGVDLLHERSDERYDFGGSVDQERATEVVDVEVLGRHLLIGKQDCAANERGDAKPGCPRRIRALCRGRSRCRQPEPLRKPALGVDRRHQEGPQHGLGLGRQCSNGRGEFAQQQMIRRRVRRALEFGRQALVAEERENLVHQGLFGADPALRQCRVDQRRATRRGARINLDV